MRSALHSAPRVHCTACELCLRMHMHAPHIHIHIHELTCRYADMQTCRVAPTRHPPGAGGAVRHAAWLDDRRAVVSRGASALGRDRRAGDRPAAAAGTSHLAPRTPLARCNAHPVRIGALVHTPCTHACMDSPTRALAQQGTRVGSTANLTVAGSSTSSGVWALSLSACGGLLAAVSSDGRLEARCQEGAPGGQGAAASYRLVSRGLVQLHDAPHPEAAAAGAESSARAMRVLLGEAAEAPPPLAPDGQAPTPPYLALRVVAFNPNPAHRQWVVCAGPSGLLACVCMPSSGKPSGKSKGRPPKGKAPKAGRESGAWAAVDQVCGMPVSDPD
jgi:hypothetical protein